MSSHDLIEYLDYYDKKYRGETQVRTLVDAIFDVTNQSELLKIHDIYCKPLPPQPSRFKEMISLLFVNSDILDVITVDAHVYKIYGNRLPQPENVNEFIEDCDRFEYKLFWDRNIHQEYFRNV